MNRETDMRRAVQQAKALGAAEDRERLEALARRQDDHRAAEAGGQQAGKAGAQ